MYEATAKLMAIRGVEMIGQEMSEAEAIRAANQFDSEKPFCLVRNWQWLDLLMPDEVRLQLLREGSQPVMLYSDCVVYDSIGLHYQGDWVRSIPLICFSHGIFFETSHSVYVLLGQGVRKSVELRLALRIYEE